MKNGDVRVCVNLDGQQYDTVAFPFDLAAIESAAWSELDGDGHASTQGKVQSFSGCLELINRVG